MCQRVPRLRFRVVNRLEAKIYMLIILNSDLGPLAF